MGKSLELSVFRAIKAEKERREKEGKALFRRVNKAVRLAGFHGVSVKRPFWPRFRPIRVNGADVNECYESFPIKPKDLSLDLIFRAGLKGRILRRPEDSSYNALDLVMVRVPWVELVPVILIKPPCRIYGLDERGDRMWKGEWVPATEDSFLVVLKDVMTSYYCHLFGVNGPIPDHPCDAKVETRVLVQRKLAMA